MWWGIGIAIVVVAWLVIRWGTNDVRYIGRVVGKALDIKRPIIEQVAFKMGQERSTMMAKQLKGWPEDMLQTAVTVVFIYQIVRDSQPRNVLWWKKRLEEKGFSSELTLENVETSFMYLRAAGEAFDVSQPWKFLDAYKQQFESA
jgi:hypothetical protein